MEQEQNSTNLEQQTQQAGSELPGQSTPLPSQAPEATVHSPSLTKRKLVIIILVAILLTATTLLAVVVTKSRLNEQSNKPPAQTEASVVAGLRSDLLALKPHKDEGLDSLKFFYAEEEGLRVVSDADLFMHFDPVSESELVTALQKNGLTKTKTLSPGGLGVTTLYQSNFVWCNLQIASTAHRVTCAIKSRIDGAVADKDAIVKADATVKKAVSVSIHIDETSGAKIAPVFYSPVSEGAVGQRIYFVNLDGSWMALGGGYSTSLDLQGSTTCVEMEKIIAKHPELSGKFENTNGILPKCPPRNESI